MRQQEHRVRLPDRIPDLRTSVTVERHCSDVAVSEVFTSEEAMYYRLFGLLLDCDGDRPSAGIAGGGVRSSGAAEACVDLSTGAGAGGAPASC